MKQKKTNSLRKILTGFCAFSMAMMICFGVISVNAQEDAKIAAAACTAERGATTAVAFTLEGNPGIWGLKFRVGYDHSVLTLTSVTNGTIFSEGDVTPPESLDQDQYVYLASSNKLEDISEDGTIVTLNFSVADSAEMKSYPITLEVTQAINVDGEDLNLSAKEGSVTVTMNEPEESEEPNHVTEAPGKVTEEPAKAAEEPKATAANYASVVQPANHPQRTAESVTEPKKIDKVKKKESPRTVDNSSLAVWAAFALVSGSAALALGFSDRKSKAREN